MTRKKNATIRGANVTINTSNANPPRAKAPKRRRNRVRKAGLGGEMRMASMMDDGRMTYESNDLSMIRNLRGAKCFMDENTEGWYFKYLDPAGSVETARAIGEFSKIPDGLLTFSVDAEIRVIDTLAVPRVEDEVGGPGVIPLTGATWSLTIFSYPMFRTAYIAVANRFDKEISTTIASELAFVLNNLTSYRDTIDSDIWAPFAEGIEAGWYFWIKPLPPTYNLADPIVGDQRTLTSWRMSYKSLTVEHNAPTLIDQGFWNGGHFALDATSVQQQGAVPEMVSSFVHGRATIGFNSSAAARYTIRIPNLPQITSIVGPATIDASDISLHFTVTGNNSAVGGAPVTFVVPPGTAWYNPFEVVFAEPGDIVSLSVDLLDFNVVHFTSNHALSTPFDLVFPLNDPTLPPGSTFVDLNAEALVEIYVDNALAVFTNRTSNQIEFPAYNPSQLAANNPKMEQFLMKETNGAYLVHKKMRKPVFEVTPAGAFGPIQFTTPDYDIRRNSNDGSGILDTIDANMSTAVVCIRGIAHANVPVVKLYQGWEGITNVNTPFGQFGHTGLARNDCVMQLVDNLTVRTTGVYPANDNFLGLIARFAAGALKNLLSSEATSGMLGNLAQSVISKGLDSAKNRLDRVGQPRNLTQVRGRLAGMGLG